MIIPQRSKLVMIGDSITDCDRVRPIGEGKGDTLGHGYVSHINALIEATYPLHEIRIVNMGISGNTVRELKQRWQSDVLDLSPNWLSVMIGINDVMRHFNRRHLREMHISVQEYENTLDELISSAKRSTVEGVILMTPFFIEQNSSDRLREMTDIYGKVVKRIALRHDAILVDVQQAFDRYLEHHYSLEIASDRVHPTQTGNMIIARAWLQALGYSWEA
ncbi:GDSL family lipase [Paenibacillus sp. MY03]|uniref:SGNH/GDSL hydrolase family protein n=1 Tax=Paenibacillus sp. MY03 TaxID=302980 RepID=UPI000B3C9F4C|nr:SGNH/GDSL hydrolase family protein [Paenibacillus sp. MY03]OUS77277.1 GDSL family lipase [Paenibacillus sp. MY03]